MSRNNKADDKPVTYYAIEFWDTNGKGHWAYHTLPQSTKKNAEACRTTQIERGIPYCDMRIVKVVITPVKEKASKTK